MQCAASKNHFYYSLGAHLTKTEKQKPSEYSEGFFVSPPFHYRFLKGAAFILPPSEAMRRHTMNVNIGKHKKKLAAVLVLGVTAAISIPLLMPGKPAEDTVREREYTATRDTITVGVESSGLVDAGPNAHSFEAGKGGQ